MQSVHIFITATVSTLWSTLWNALYTKCTLETSTTNPLNSSHSGTKNAQTCNAINLQVTRLVVTEVQSKSFGLRWLQSAVTTTHVLAMRLLLCEASSIFHRQVWYCTFSLCMRTLCAYLTFGHHPHPLGYPCAKFHFYLSPTAELARREKLRTRSLIQSLTQLFDMPGTEAFVSE